MDKRGVRRRRDRRGNGGDGGVAGGHGRGRGRAADRAGTGRHHLCAGRLHAVQGAARRRPRGPCSEEGGRVRGAGRVGGGGRRGGHGARTAAARRVRGLRFRQHGRHPGGQAHRRRGALHRPDDAGGGRPADHRGALGGDRHRRGPGGSRRLRRRARPGAHACGHLGHRYAAHHDGRAGRGAGGDRAGAGVRAAGRRGHGVRSGRCGRRAD